LKEGTRAKINLHQRMIKNAYPVTHTNNILLIFGNIWKSNITESA
jgi:hypothetical protein